MNRDLIEELIEFFENERLEIAGPNDTYKVGSQFTVEEVDTIIEALVRLDNDLDNG